MTAFAAGRATLHADPNRSTAASFRRPPYTWQPCRVILSEPTEITGERRGGALQAEIRAAAITDIPQPGDELKVTDSTHRLYGTVFTIHDPERDAEGLSWRVSLSEGT